MNADRASLFLLDTKTYELYARIFDTGKEHVPQKEIRLVKKNYILEISTWTQNVPSSKSLKMLYYEYYLNKNIFCLLKLFL